MLNLASIASFDSHALQNNAKNPNEEINSQHYSNIRDFLSQSDINGNIRSYYFVKDYSIINVSNQRSFSLGGKLNILTAPFLGGCKLGATLYTAQPLGLNHSYNSGVVDKSLPAISLTTLGQSYIQYTNHGVIARLGNQLIKTPWVNEADSRMIPATYQGFFTSIDNEQGKNIWSIQMMRLVRFKGRPVKNFSRSNLYNNSFDIGIPINKLLGTHDNGLWALGLRFKDDTFKAQGWSYRFNDYANLNYVDLNYESSNELLRFFKPIVGTQLVYQNSSGDDLIAAVGAGKVGTMALGALVGIKIIDAQITYGYNSIRKRSDGFNNGGIVSPYTANYVSDPLYTSSMIAGLIEKAAGTAYKISGLFNFFNEQCRLGLSYAKYSTSPFILNTNETDIDFTYLPSPFCKNLSLRYRLGLQNGDTVNQKLAYHRLMFEYLWGQA